MQLVCQDSETLGQGNDNLANLPQSQMRLGRVDLHLVHNKPRFVRRERAGRTGQTCLTWVQSMSRGFPFALSLGPFSPKQAVHLMN